MACFKICVSSVLTQNEDIWNFHGSLTLKKGNQFDILEDFSIPLCQI